MKAPAFFRDNILTLNRIVETINDGGTSSSTPAELAGYYAYDAALDGSDDIGTIDEDTIAAHLDVLAEHGAQFDYSDAVSQAMLYVAAKD